MTEFLSTKIFKISFLLIFFLEVLSFIFFVNSWGQVVFLLLILGVFFLTLYKLEYGLLILLAEVFIGSKGYLFFYDYDGSMISIRIALWLIVMSVWLAKFLLKAREYGKEFISYFIKNYQVLIILFFFIVWGLINGFLEKHTLANIFFDFNAWLFFALIFPLSWEIFIRSPEKKKNFFKNIFSVFAASVAWLSFETLFLFFIFTHKIGGLSIIYRWVRVTGVGEITMMPDNLYRIFLQSHIFILIAFVFSLLWLWHVKKRPHKETEIYLAFIFLSIFASVSIISLSRSNWLGMVLGLSLLVIFLGYKYGVKDFLFLASTISLSVLVGVILAIALARFPYPAPSQLQLTDSLVKRASQIKGEAGVSSRWALLPKLLSQIKKSPVLGSGFGTTVTYKSSDPKILEHSPDGNYTTYAFEWGWFDVWLKLGFFGLLSYLVLVGNIVICGVKRSYFSFENQVSLFGLGFVFSLIILSVIHFFSPYFNHPLGINFVLVSLVYMNSIEKN